jgi:HAMP domain-containing protein
MPVLMLTTADRIDDKASGFELGADDYLTKPFDLQERVLRLRALDRRRAHNRPPVRNIAGLRLILIRSDLLRTFALTVAYALAFLLVFGLLGGWILVGRMLAPLTRITEATRMAATGSLAHRIEMEGREDEFRELADAFDAMLARLESASWGARVIGHIDDNLAVLARREAAIEGRGCLGQCEC